MLLAEVRVSSVLLTPLATLAEVATFFFLRWSCFRRRNVSLVLQNYSCCNSCIEIIISSIALELERGCGTHVNTCGVQRVCLKFWAFGKPDGRCTVSLSRGQPRVSDRECMIRFCGSALASSTHHIMPCLFVAWVHPGSLFCWWRRRPFATALLAQPDTNYPTRIKAIPGANKLSLTPRLPTYPSINYLTQKRSLD